MLLVLNPHLHDIMYKYSRRINMTTNTPKHDLDHEVYIDPKDHKEHVNHGMIEYTEADLEMHNDAFHAHSEDEVDKNEGKINDWHTRQGSALRSVL